MVDTTKDRNLNIRVSDDELRMLADLAAHEERSVSDVVRRLIRKAHAKLGVSNPTRKGARKRS